ncbi:MAG: hypothetical protein V7638_199 [Acidobacteriota bacterium]|jgi:hypothetical protein
MNPVKYKEIDLKIDLKAGSYEVSASSECGGNATTTFSIDELSLGTGSSSDKNVSNTGEPPPTTAGLSQNLSLIRVQPPSLAEARAFGQQLFNAIFKNETWAILDRCLQAAKKDRQQVRFWLNLSEVPQLAGLPWEFLCLVPQGTFFAKSYDSVVRYLDLLTPYDEALITEPPLRILAVLSNPEGVPRLDVDGELKKLQHAINSIEGVVLDPLYNPTIKALRKRLHEHRESAPYHVFHFIGHAAFDSAANQGKLLLENEARGINQISAQELGEILATHRSLRLAVINACEGARTALNNSYAGVAQTLLRSGAAPKVIAMQYVISDDAAKIFAQSFYTELLKGTDLDSAIAMARMDISDRELEESRRDSVEWGTPVIYMRAKDSRLVGFPTCTKEVTEMRDAPPPITQGPIDKHYREVITALSEGQLVPFLGLDINLFDKQSSRRPPTYDELVKRVAQLSQYPHTARELPGVSQYAQMPNRLAILYDKLDPVFNDETFKPTKLHEFWAYVARAQTSFLADVESKRAPFLIVTTNYDTLLEREFMEKVEDFHVFSYIADGSTQERGRFFHKEYHDGRAGAPILVDNNNMELNDEWPVILKLPGSIEPFNSKVRFAITEDHYFELLTNRELTNILPTQVMTKLRNSSHLFLGWTLSDWSLRGILYRIWEKSWPSYPSWTVQKGLIPFERKYWEACQIEIVEEDLAQYITALEEHLKGSLQTSVTTNQSKL